MSILNRVILVALCGAGTLLADATFTEQVHFNGGTLIDMMKNMPQGQGGPGGQGQPTGGAGGARRGPGGGQPFQDQTAIVYVKGNKMARVNGNNTTIIDLDAGTLTTINENQKTYVVRTFDEIKQQMKAMQERMGIDSTPVEFDAKVKKTGKTKDIGGQAANEAIVTMTAKNSSEGNGMKIVSDIWMVPTAPGSDDVRAFYKKAAEKGVLDLMGGGRGGAMMGGAGRAGSALRSQLATMDGVAVESKADISGASIGGPMAAMMGGDAADPNAVALSTTTTASNFQAGPVDDSHFIIPAGYKKMDPSQWGGGQGRRRPDQQPQQPPQ